MFKRIRDVCMHLAESETVFHGDRRRRHCMVSKCEAPCSSFYNCMFTLLFFLYMLFFMDQESSITFLSCNDADLIKIFIGFYKIISYILFPGALQGGWRQGREKDRRDYIKNEVEKENILFYTEMMFPE